VAGRWDYTRTPDGKVSDLGGGHLFGNLVQLRDGRVLVAGGHSFWALPEEGFGPEIPGVPVGTTVLATDTEFFDPATGVWSQGTPLPTIPGEDDAIGGSHGGRTNGVCLAALRDDTVVIAGGATEVDGTAFPSTLRTRSSIVVMTPGSDARNSTYQISPNAIPPGAGSGGLFGDGGRFQLPCYVMSTGKVMIAGGQNNAGEDLYDAYLFNPRTFTVTRGPDLVHGVALWAPAGGYPAGFQFSAISTKEVGMRNSRLAFPGDVLVLGGGYDPISLDPAGSRRIEQFGTLHHGDK
jgi:hypothetical protein